MAELPLNLAAALGGKPKMVARFRGSGHNLTDFTTSGLLGKAVLVALYGDFGANELARRPSVDLNGNTAVEIMNTTGGSHSSNSSAEIYFIPKVTAELTFHFFQSSYNSLHDYYSVFTVE